MKRKMITSLLFSLLLITGCGNKTETEKKTTTTTPATEKEMTEEKTYKGLVNTNIDLNLRNDEAEVFFQDNTLAKIEVINNHLVIRLLKEGNTKFEIRLKDGKKEYHHLIVYDFSFSSFESTPIGESIHLEKSKEEAVFSLSDDSIATIDSNNNLKGLKEGWVKVSMTYDDVSYSRDIHITKKENRIQRFYRNSTYLKFHGRNEFNTASVSMDNEAAGFEATFYGTSLSCEMQGYYASYYGPTMFSVIIDDNTDYNTKSFAFTSTDNREYTLAKNLERGFHTIKVLKRTEAGATYATLTSLTTDGYFVKNREEKKLKMEAYGDSITAGYGNLRSETEPDGTNSKIQNTLMTYECVATRILDADINVMARSGIGLSVAHNIVGDYNMNTRYEYMTPLSDTKWNMHNYVPDVVIINLGTNDSWSGKFDRKTFVSQYVTLVKNLVASYGNEVSFVLCCGLMEQGVYPILKNYVYPSLLKEGIQNIATLEFEKSASNGHPLIKEHQKAGEALADTIKDLLEL